MKVFSLSAVSASGGGSVALDESDQATAETALVSSDAFGQLLTGGGACRMCTQRCPDNL